MALEKARARANGPTQNTSNNGKVPGKGRVSYALAGAAMRLAIERAAALKLTVTERKVLDAVLVLTASYSRLQDRVYGAQVAEIAGCHERRARQSLSKLAAAGVLRWEPSRGVGKKSLLGLYPAVQNGAAVAPLSPMDNSSKRSDSCSVRRSGSCSATEELLREEVLGVLNAPTENLSGEGRVGPCVVCDLIDQDAGELRGGQWWCSAHLEKSKFR